MGKSGLYGMMGSLQKRTADEMPLFWVLNMSINKHCLLDISDRSGLDFDLIKNAVDVLLD